MCDSVALVRGVFPRTSAQHRPNSQEEVEHGDGIDYVFSIAPECDVFDPGTVFVVPPRKPGSRGPAPSALATDAQPRPINELVAGLDPEAFGPVAFRDIDGGQLVSRFAFVRVIAAHPVTRDRQAPREEWLIVESPEGHEHPSDYWISNLPADTEPEQLARLARLRWMIELDYKQLKGELGTSTHRSSRSRPGPGPSPRETGAASPTPSGRTRAPAPAADRAPRLPASGWSSPTPPRTTSARACACGGRSFPP
jgi:hypothetical protein